MPEVRLIDRQALLSDIDKEIEFFSSSAGNHDYFDYAKKNGLVIAKQIVGRQPTIEPKVRRGRWIYRSDDAASCYCSECNEEALTAPYERNCIESDFCPCCGAKMDGGEEDAGI